jgi:hypothetical protein
MADKEVWRIPEGFYTQRAVPLPPREMKISQGVADWMVKSGILFQDFHRIVPDDEAEVVMFGGRERDNG